MKIRAVIMNIVLENRNRYLVSWVNITSDCNDIPTLDNVLSQIFNSLEIKHPIMAGPEWFMFNEIMFNERFNK